MNAEFYAEKSAALLTLDGLLESDDPPGAASSKNQARYHLRMAARALREVSEALTPADAAETGGRHA